MKKRKVKKFQGDSEGSETKTREKDLSEREDQRPVLILKENKRKKKGLDGDTEDSMKKKKKKKEKRVGEGSKKVFQREQNRALLLKREKQSAEDEPVAEISAVDEDFSRGMKKWVLEYHQRRPGLDEIQERINNYIASYEAEQEEARREREARAAEEGWTVVVHHKGRKKTTEPESGIAMGSISQAAAEAKMAMKKEDLALDFYRFQKREAQRNEVMMLQSKFEQDKKRLQHLRAARKFRPY